MTIPLLDLKREYAPIAAEVQEAWRAVLASMTLLNGEQVASFEREIAAYVGVPFACGVASGTDALTLALAALGIGLGDEVIVHANAFAADVEAIHQVGAQPRLVDVAADSFGPDLEQVAAAIGTRTKAVMVVHLYGAALALDAILELTRRAGCALVEDASHAHGATRNGRKTGSFGVLGCFSAGIVKNLGAYGDAGFITTTDADLDHRLRLLRAPGQEKKNHHLLYGFNSRLDELHAAVLRVKLRHLDARNQRRRDIAAYYRGRFSGLDLRVSSEAAGEAHVYHQFVVRTSQRDRLAAHLRAAGVETGIHYPTPLHRQPSWLQRYGEAPALPRAEQLAREILSIPVFPDLTDTEVDHVASAVVSFFS